jgi:hypothetical protein
MENLPRHLFDADYYNKVNPDIAKAGVDGYDHYFQYGVKESRHASLNYNELNIDQLRTIYYHTIQDDYELSPEQRLPFYLKSDIILHLPILEYYASKCSHITELGVRDGHSTLAFLYGLPENGKLESYDIEETLFVTWLESKNLAKWEFHKRNTADTSLKIKETDFIFFDTLHSYEQLSKELVLHAEKSSKFLAFHDTFSCRTVCNEDKSKEGIKRAIDEYVNSNTCKIVYQTDLCNGLMVLEK